MDELKPCPFCGAEPRLLDCTQLDRRPMFRGHRGIACWCGAIMIAPTNAEAVEAWNRRADNAV